MIRRTRRLVLVLALVATTLLGGSPSGAAPATETRPARLAGPDRLATAIALSQAGWPSSDTVLIARSDDPADALAGSALAGHLGAPLLITPSAGLPGSVATEVRRLGARRAVILGGAAAVSRQVEQDLRDAGVDDVDRIEGRTRFETAARIAAELGDTVGHTAIVVGAWPDALGVSGLAASRAAAGDAWPVFLTGRSLPAATLDGLRAMDPVEVLVAGGGAAVSDEAYAQLEAEFDRVRRVAGSDRYATSLRFAQLRPGGGPLVIATGGNFPDGLAAGPYAAAIGGTLLLVPPGRVPTGHLAWLAPGGVADELRVVGGPAAVPPEIEVAIWAALARDHVSPTPALTGAVRIETVDDAQSVVDAHPAGTTFVFASGVHRGVTVRPRSGDRYVGENGAVLSGARLLPPAAWTPAGGDWFVGGQTQQGSRDGELEAGGNARHRHPEELFVDGLRWEHVGSRAGLAPGTWFFDYEADRIWIGVNPETLGTIETSVTELAFDGTRAGTDGVTIANLTIDKYATPTRIGAINAPVGADWVLQRLTITNHHGAGVFAGPGARIERCLIAGNGQVGIRVRGTFGYGARQGHGRLITVASNRIEGNAVLDFRRSWEAGGLKGIELRGLAFVNNLVSDNGGSGVWTDVDSRDVVVAGNRIEDNGWRGVLIELTKGADLVWNEIVGNGDSDDIFREAGIYVSNSQDVEIRANLLAGNPSGILARSAGDRDLPIRRLDVHDNDVQFATGRTGMFIDNGATGATYTSHGNRFHANTYRVADDGGHHWIWGDATTTDDTDRAGDWDTWQGQGNDVTGTLLETTTPGDLPDDAVAYAPYAYGAR